MSARIFSTDFRIYGSKPAWHALRDSQGRTHKGAFLTTEEVHAEIGGEVEKIPVTIPGTNIPIPGQYHTRRVDLAPDNPNAYLGIVGEQYRVVQNAQIIDLVAAFCGAAGARFESAFTMMNGRRIVVAAQMPQDLVIRGNGGAEPLRRYFIGGGAHDGTQRVYLRSTGILPVCWNTISAALAQAANEITIMHTDAAGYAIDNVVNAAAAQNEHFAQLAAAASYLAGEPANGETVRQYLTKMFPNPAKPKADKDPAKREAAEKRYENAAAKVAAVREAVESIFADNPLGEDTRHGTVWGLVQTVAGKEEWSGRLRLAGGAEKADPEQVAEAHLSALWGGNIGQNIDRAYREGLALVGAAS